MKKSSARLFIAALSAFPMLVTGMMFPYSACAAEVEITAEPGLEIFDPKDSKYDYRYGPSMILNEDGSLDVWFASPGAELADGSYEWDWIRHKRTTDGGQTWSEETIVLRPTPDSLDQISICDPAVFKFGGYYYLSVTATDNADGFRNQIFVARSKSATGPFEKWNGGGWGGKPAPFITFQTPPKAWGVGEPAFTIKGDTLYIYYTYLITDPDGSYAIGSGGKAGDLINQTHLATAPLGPDWPAHIKPHGKLWDRTEGEDSMDVKYIPSADLFLSISTAKRMTADAHVIYRTSKDGIHFSEPKALRENIKPWCHNAGISSGTEGWIDPSTPVYLAYAYSNKPEVSWGVWHTWLNPVKITVTGNAAGEEKTAVDKP
jgi:hypothetical protein